MLAGGLKLPPWSLDLLGKVKKIAIAHRYHEVTNLCI
jgi:hypothetical protein